MFVFFSCIEFLEKIRKTYILYRMTNYIANSKNRKLKKQILAFFDRLNFWTGKLPISGRVVLFFTAVLTFSLFFPWFHFGYSDGQNASFFAFSAYTGYVGYGIVLSLILIPFFLLSHEKKEQIRAHVPFRLSDTQAVVFITSMLVTAFFHLLFMSSIFDQFAIEIQVGKGFLIAMSSSVCILVSAFFLSKSTKEQSIEMRYLDHHEVDALSEYRSILSKWAQSDKQDEKNMTLPI